MTRRNTLITMISMLMIITMTSFMVGCKDSKEEEKAETEDYKLSVETGISYSAGNDNEWTYGNQRKEFATKQQCYVRIGCKAITGKKKGIDKEIGVTFRFTGLDNCDVELSDNYAEKRKTDDPNVVEYTAKLNAKKAKKATDELFIFRYYPKKKCEMVLEVIYDDSVGEQYDQRNTVYFAPK